MFDVYIQEQSIDPRLRNRMMASLTTAAALTVCAGIAAWSVDKLKISTVAPPKSVEMLMVAIDPDPPPPAAPPDRPERVQAAADDGPTRERAADKPEVDRAEDYLEPSRPSSDRGPIGKDEGGGKGKGSSDRVPLSGMEGSPCLIGMSCTNVVAAQRPAAPPPSEERVEKVPFDAMKALYAPDPPQAELARTRTGLGSKRPGSVRVEFCIDAQGKVARSRVVKRFPGDASIDTLARSTVARWRFRPMLVGGRARAACSAVTFDIRFD